MHKCNNFAAISMFILFMLFAWYIQIIIIQQQGHLDSQKNKETYFIYLNDTFDLSYVWNIIELKLILVNIKLLWLKLNLSIKEFFHWKWKSQKNVFIFLKA